MSKTSTHITSVLNCILSDTYILAIKTHAAHWNVTGPSFTSLHLAFEGQYAALMMGADILAERLRALGKTAPFGAKSLLSGSTIKESITNTDGLQLANVLASDHRFLAKICTQAAEEADKVGDCTSSDLLVVRVGEHEKIAWVLESTAA